MSGLQTDREIAVSSPLGDDALLFHTMEGHEELGRLFEYHLALFSRDHNIRLEDVLGKSLTVRLETSEGDRFYNGLVSQFSYEGVQDDRAFYRATLRPWFWFLTRTRDCRIFQEKTVPDIIKEIFDEHGFSDYEEALSGSYRTWEYCVQYRESAFDFVSRLMEQEGIYYYFKHEDGRHVLVISDSYSSHDTLVGHAEVPYYPPVASGEARRREQEHVFEWRVAHQAKSGVFALRDYNFETPSASLESVLSRPADHAIAEKEYFDYPGEYIDGGEGETSVRLIQEQHHGQYERVQGQCDVRTFSVGGLFALTGFPRQDQNREYLIVGAHYSLRSAKSYGSSSAAGSGPVFDCRFEAIESSVQYRSARTTPKSTVSGPQTAVVVGKAGEEIWTDKYGRIKVQFHWDRYGQKDENSSCWIRVAQVWAGKNWGAMHIPRIGQEVIVDFLEGDPDQPIVTGRVYNAEQMPPYELPSNQTQSGIKSRSSKGGGTSDFNEFRFEDKKGEEEVYLHAQKDFNIIVENDETREVQHDRSATITNNDTLDVGVDRTVTIGNNETVQVGVDRTTTIGSNNTSTVGMNRSSTIGSNDTLTVAQNRTVTAGSSISETAAMSISLTAGGGVTITAPMVTIAAPMVSCSGVLQCTTLITSSVVSPLYTPGAGNIV